MTKNSKILLLILIALLLGAYIFYYSLKLKSSPPSLPPVVNQGLTETEKENAAKAMNQQLKNIPSLTEKQKEDIAKKMIQSL